tara:strand:- start:334 stop:1116 length:783 start_codon:yes stop_codon:yes gene_type:complete
MRFNFPSLCFDGFYNDPDSVREFALSIDDYTNKIGYHPGLRSRLLLNYDEQFCRKSIHKFISLFNDWGLEGATFECSTMFQKIWRFSSDPNDPVNTGWIHLDDDVDIAGVVYLDPNPDINNGTSFYYPSFGKSVEEIETSTVRESREFIQRSYDSGYVNVLEGDPPEYERILGDKTSCCIDDIDWFRKNIVINNKQFELTMEIKNCYNRCIAYSGNQMHGQSNYWMPNEDDFRLAQVFFISNLKLPQNFITAFRVNSYDV